MTGREPGGEDQTELGAWIVGTDGSDSSEHALRWAAEHSAGRASALRIVTSWQAPLYGPYPPVATMVSPYDNDAIQRGAQTLVDDAVARITPEVDLPVEAMAVHGGASSVLLDAAEHGTLLVVGNRGRGGFGRLLLGSTSTQCATHTSVPTVVVPDAAPVIAADRITVGVDGSPNSLAALLWALDFARDEATVTAIWAWDTSPLAVGADQFFFPEAVELAEERFDHMLDSILAGRRNPVHLVRTFVRDAPRTALRQAAKDADLVVVGKRGHGMIGAALLGSVSTWLLHHLDVPVVIVPDGARPEAAGVNPDSGNHDSLDSLLDGGLDTSLPTERD